MSDSNTNCDNRVNINNSEEVDINVDCASPCQVDDDGGTNCQNNIRVQEAVG